MQAILQGTDKGYQPDYYMGLPVWRELMCKATKSNIKIFSGEYSKRMWRQINKAKTKRQLRTALYTVCCKLQELEDRIDNG